MKLCAVSDGLGHLPFEEVAKVAAELGLSGLEICMGNWSGAPHADLQSLLESSEKRRDFLSVLERNGLSLAASTAVVISFTRLTEKGKARLFMTRCDSPNCSE
jgi:sugar phosphate isomerase/epimerase